MERERERERERRRRGRNEVEVEAPVGHVMVQTYINRRGQSFYIDLYYERLTKVSMYTQDININQSKMQIS